MFKRSGNVILTPEALEETVQYFMRQNAFVFDVESMGENRNVPTQNKVTWIGLATHGKAVTIPFGHPIGDRVIGQGREPRADKKGKIRNFKVPIWEEPPEQLLPADVFSALKPLFFSERTKIAHNAPFDLISVHKYWGETPPPEYACTITYQWLLNENLKFKGLKEVVKRLYGVDYDQENVGKCVEKHPFSKVAHYNLMDARYTWLRWLKLAEQLAGRGMEGIRRLEMDVLEVLLAMGLTGAPVDTEALHLLDADLSERLVEIEARIYQAAGRKFNVNSSPQKQQVLFAPKREGGQGLRPTTLTDGGKKNKKAGRKLTLSDFSTGADVLESYANNPVAKTVLEYQEVNKLLGTYVKGYLGDEAEGKPCRIFDGRIHTDLVQYGTVTGRFSSREPNLQNIPRPDTELGKQIRGLFVAPPGHKLVVADYGQIEMVVLAHFVGHGRLFDGFWQGIDPHTATAAAVFNVPVEKVTKEQRQVAKGINFAVIYGAGPDKVASMAGITSKEAKEFLQIHQRMFPEIYRFKEKVLKVCKSRRPPHVKTLLGRYRRLPAIWSSDGSVRGEAERQAINSLIQGSAADLIKLAMVRLHSALPEEMRLILSVHDELVTIAPNDRAEECERIVREAMLGEGIQKLVGVPLTSDIKVVDRWAEAK